MRKRVFVIGLVLLVCMATGLWAQGQSDAKSDEKTIVFVNPLVGHPVYIAQEDGMKLAAEKLGFKPVIVGPTVIDAQNMVTEIETAIAQRVDGIVTVPFNWSAFKNVYQKAADAGIPVVNTGAETPEEWRLSFIGTDNKAYGVLAADLLAEKMDGEAEICIMMSQLDVANQVEIKESFEARIAEAYPNMNVAVVEADKADMMLAVQKFEEIFKSHPEVNAVVQLEATGGNAAAKVIDEYGIADEVVILAIDDMAETLDNVRKGLIWGTLAQNFYKQGYLSAKYILDNAEGKTVPSIVDSGVVLITKDNVDTYADDMWAFLDE